MTPPPVTSPPVTSPGRLQNTPASMLAAVLSGCYALALLALHIQFLTRGGPRPPLGDVARFLHGGVADLPVALLAVAALLGAGAVMVWRGRRGLLVIAPMSVIVVLGALGEIADGLDGALPLDTMIGALVVVLAAVPIVLLLLPRGAAPTAGAPHPRPPYPATPYRAVSYPAAPHPVAPYAAAPYPVAPYPAASDAVSPSSARPPHAAHPAPCSSEPHPDPASTLEE